MSTKNPASTASAITEESTAVDLWAEIWRLREAVKGPKGFETWQDAATDERIRRVRAEKELAAHIGQGVSETPAEPELCPHCDGTGEQTYMSDGGPDAYEEIGNCEHCGGAQTLAAAYVGLKNMLDRTEKAYREATAILWHCNAGPTAAGRLEQLAKTALQPEHAQWMHDRLMALADMARVSPNAAAVEPSQPAPAAPSQHDADSRELRSLCHARDKARLERDLLQVDVAALEASVGNLCRLVDDLQPGHDRYQYLRERSVDTIAIGAGGVFAGIVPDNVVLNGEELDQAIDAALAASTRGTA